MHPIEVVLAIVLVPVDLAPYRAGYPLHYCHGVEERFSVAISQVPYFPPDVLDGQVEVVAVKLNGGRSTKIGISIGVSKRVGGIFEICVEVRDDGALQEQSRQERGREKKRERVNPF